MIQIRRKQTEDIPQIAKVHYVTYIDTYKGLLPEAHLSNQKEEEYVKQHQSFNAACWVAIDNSEIVGVIMYGPSRDTDLEKSYEIYMIYVLPEYQGQSIGTQLLNKVESEIKNKAAQVALWVVDSNLNTIHFYERQGYQFDGIEEEDEGFREQRMLKTL